MRSTQGLKWGYFSSDSAQLLDKIYKFEDKTFELGGEAALKIFEKKNVLAVHTTCYEQKSKVMGLKVMKKSILSEFLLFFNLLQIIYKMIIIRRVTICTIYNWLYYYPFYLLICFHQIYSSAYFLSILMLLL